MSDVLKVSTDILLLGLENMWYHHFTWGESCPFGLSHQLKIVSPMVTLIDVLLGASNVDHHQLWALKQLVLQ